MIQQMEVVFLLITYLLIATKQSQGSLLERVEVLRVCDVLSIRLIDMVVLHIRTACALLLCLTVE